MKAKTGLGSAGAGPGFTLIELLLATVLLLLLLSAVIFNFSSLQHGAELDEGAAQFEALLRYARAEAANSGRSVQLSFEEDVGDGFSIPLGEVHLTWAADPFEQPGQFQEIKTAANYVDRIDSLLEIESVRLSDPNGNDMREFSMTNDTDQIDGTNDVLYAMPPITFYPDGSSDSAEIVLASRDENDTRRVGVRVVGITGVIRRQVVSDEADLEEPTNEESDVDEPGGTIERTVSRPTPPAAAPARVSHDVPQ